MTLTTPLPSLREPPPASAPAPAGAACARWGRQALALASLLAASRTATAAEVDFRGGLDWYSAGTVARPADGVTNAGNVLLQVPQLDFETELRPSLRLELGPLQAIARPQFLLDLSDTRVDGLWKPATLQLQARIIEAYGAWTVNDYLGLSFGLQNFQWGPAEALNPSNTIFHRLGFAQNILTAYRGRELVRVNVSPSRAVNILGLMEVAPNDEPAFVAGQPFERRGLLKVELSPADGADYVGLTGGKGETSPLWFGEYGTWAITDGLSLYGDARHTQGSDAWYPVDTGALFAQSLLASRRIQTLAVIGTRYTFPGARDVRLEYIHNDAGYTKEQIASATRNSTLLAAADPSARADATASGLELPGKHYLYVSTRLPELGPGGRWKVDLRYLLSLTDSSGAGFVNVEWASSDALILFASATGYPGKQDSDLNRLLQASATIGSKYSW